MNVHLEFDASLAHFISFFGLNFSPEKLDEFRQIDNRRKSILLLDDDTICAVEEFLTINEVLTLAYTNKYFYSRISEARVMITNWYYPMNILPKEPNLMWKQLCVDWYVNQMNNCHNLRNSINKIKKAEKPLKYCMAELKMHSQPALDPLPQTFYSIRSYRCQIKSEKKSLDDAWKSVSDEVIEFEPLIRWMYTDTGFISDIPEIDNRLYGGLPKEEMLRQSEEDFRNDYEDDYIEWEARLGRGEDSDSESDDD
jgi:hypothetical protein